MKWWLRFQAWTFLPVTSGCFVIWFWQWVKDPLDCLQRGWYMQLFWMAAGHVSRYFLMKTFLCPELSPLWAYLWAVTIPQWFGGIYIFGHFSTSHTHLDTMNSDVTKNWVRYAVEHTIDIDPSNNWVNWIMGYLNCQVIHHLYPAMPQYHQPKVSARFAAFCKKWKLPYRVMGYGEAFHATFTHLDEVGKKYWNGEKHKAL
jgi:fatty acid desaturase